MGRVRIIAITALTPVLWGSTYVVTTELLPPDRPFTAAAIRALPIGILLVLVTRSLPERAWLWRVGALGLLNFGLFFPLLFLAAYRLPGGIAATVGATGPFMVAALSASLLGRKPPHVVYMAGTVGAVGVSLLVLRGETVVDLLGVGAAALATLSLSLGIVLTKRWGSPVGAVTFAGWQLVAGGLVLVPLALVLEGAPPRPDLESSLGFTYLGLIATGFAYVIWFRGIARLPATGVSFLSLLSPVSATLLGLAVLGQTLSWLQLLGALLVLGSAALGQSVQVAKPAHGEPSVAATRGARSRLSLRHPQVGARLVRSLGSASERLTASNHGRVRTTR